MSSDPSWERYPYLMPIPFWAVDAANKLMDTDRLVLLEGTLRVDEAYDTRPVLVLCQVDLQHVSDRIDVQPLAIVIDTDLMGKITIDPETTSMYSLVTPREGDVIDASHDVLLRTTQGDDTECTEA